MLLSKNQRKLLVLYVTCLNVHVLKFCFLPLVLLTSFIYCRIVRTSISDLLSQKESPEQNPKHDVGSVESQSNVSCTSVIF
jgi:hypothetical protein